MKRHSLALPASESGGTPRTLIPVWTLPLRHISSSLGVARPFAKRVGKNVQTLWWAELDRLHSMTCAHPPPISGEGPDLYPS